MNPTGRTPAPTPGQGPEKKEPVKEETKEVKGVKSLREKLAGAIPMGNPGKPLTNVKPGGLEKNEEPPPPNRDAPAIPPRRAQMPLPLSTAPTDMPPPMPIGAPPTRGLPAAPGQKPDKPMAEPQKTGMGDFNAALKNNPIFAKQQAMEKVGEKAKAFGFEYNDEIKLFVNKQGEGFTLEELKTQLSTNKDAQINEDYQLAMKMAGEIEAEAANAPTSVQQEVQLSMDEAMWAQAKGYNPVFSGGTILGYEDSETNAFMSNADIKGEYNFEQLAATKGFTSVAPGVFQNAQGDVVSAEELKDIIHNS